MKVCYPLFLLLIFISSLQAQPSSPSKSPIFNPHQSSHSRGSFTYSLSTSSAAYTDLVGATSLNNGEIWDDPDYVIPILFPFVLNETAISYLQFYGVGGFLVSETADPEIFTAVIPFEVDLIDRGSNGNTSLSPISYKVEGPTGNRIEKIEWKNAGSFAEYDAFGTLDMYISVQLWLFEGSNAIEFHFGPHFIDDAETFYEEGTGALIGLTEFNENTGDVFKPHFVVGQAVKPFLSETPEALNGTPASGIVYRLSLAESLDVEVTGENSTSFCAPNGTASTIVTGGSLPYTYSWNTGDTTPGLQNLDAGTYTVTVEDGSGNTATGSVTITSVDDMELTLQATDETAVDANDGTASVSVDGGTAPYTYLWSTNETTASIEDLAPGIYSVVVTDDTGCAIQEDIVVNPFGCPDLQIEASMQEPNCFGGCDGLISILDVANGSGDYSYVWFPAGQATPSISVCAGNYIVTVYDNTTGCIVEASFTIGQPSLLQVNASSTNESLVGQNDGTATAQPSGGTTPYHYAWSNGGTTFTIVDLAPGTYTVTITDDNLCTASQTVVVGAGPCGLLIAQVFDASCFDLCNGIISLDFPDGVPPVTFAWSTEDTTSTITGLCVGSYAVTVQDNAGCEIIDSFDILQPPPLFINAGSTDETAAGGDGTAWVAPTGGVAPYSYAWSNGSTDSLIINLVAGQYAVVVTDAHGCLLTEIVTVDTFACFTISEVTQFPIQCFGECSGLIAIDATEGVGPYTFLWSTGDTTNIILNLCAGVYGVTVTDAGQSCTASTSFEFEEPDSILIVVNQVIHLTDSTTTLIDISVIGGELPYSFFWAGSNGIVGFTEDLFDITPDLYTVVVQDANGCVGILDSIEVKDETVGITPIQNLDVYLYPNPANDKVYLDLTTQEKFTVELVNTDGRSLHLWNDENILDVQNLIPGFYVLKIKTSSQFRILPLIIQ